MKLIVLLFVLTFSSASFASPVTDDCCCESDFLECLAQCTHCLLPFQAILPGMAGDSNQPSLKQEITSSHPTIVPFASKVPIPPPKTSHS